MFFRVSLALFCTLVSAVDKCVPPQWEGKIGFVVGIIHNGKGQFVKGTVLMAYDAVHQRMKATEFADVGNSAIGQIDVIFDYNVKTKYILSGGACTRMALPRQFQPGCIPGKATLVSNDTFGDGSNVVDISTYKWDVGPIHVNMKVTKDTFVPVQEIASGELQGDSFHQVNGYYNITNGIRDAATFNIPQTCVNAPLVGRHFQEPSITNGAVIGKRSFLGSAFGI